ncbi:MAG: response regulator [Methylococcales bacterium]|nr:response regulator [Methylococcales bacterium]
MKIQARLLLSMLSQTAFIMIITLLLTSYLTKEALEKAAQEKLTTVLEARYSALSHWAKTLQAQLSIFAVSPTLTVLTGEFSIEFQKLGNNAQNLLQQNYSANSAHQTKLDAAIFTYDKLRQEAMSYFSFRKNAYGWDDIYLIDPQGDVIFSYQNDADFATNLKSGVWQNTGLAQAVLPLLNNAIAGQFSFSDFSQYAPKKQPASFVATPLFDSENHHFLGVVAIQIPVSQIDELVMDKTGLGETGEVIIVGKDGWMLSDSRFSKESTILKTQIQTKDAETVLAGKTQTLITPDYQGIEILAAVKPFSPFLNSLDDNQVIWGIIAKIEYSEVLKKYNTLLHILLVTTVGLMLLTILLSVLSGRSITQPLIRITNALSKLAKSEQVEIPELKRTDEIGEIAQAAQTFHSISQQLEHEHWLSENVVILTSVVSAESSVEQAANKVLHLLCQLLDIPVGAIYVQAEKGIYHRITTHGLARSNQSETSFESGVGILGQCVQSNQAIVLSPVPAGLTIISTGLAEFSPHELIVYPIPHKNNVLAVIELAATVSLSTKQYEFLKAVSEALGLHFANLQAAEHNALLLNETKRKALELRETSLYGRSLIEASLDPLVTISIDGKIMDVNAATENVTGVQREQLIGSDFCEYFTEPENARAGYKQAFANGFVTDYPLAIQHTSGKVTDVVYNASVYYDSNGDVAGIFAAARDVTDKKIAEQKMREQQEQLQASSHYARSLIEASLDPLVTISIDGKIMDVNAATENVTGVEREQLIGSDFCDYFTDPEQARRGYQQAFSHGFVTDYALAIQHVSGKVTDVVYNASVYYDNNSDIAGIFAAARDVTDKKIAEQKMLEQQELLQQSNAELQAFTEELRGQSEEMRSQNEELRSNQEELRAQQEETLLKNQLLETQSKQLEEFIAESKAKAEELKRSNQYKSEFLANMSHELRTPLNSILILSKSLAENDTNNLTDDQIESASVISESGTQLLTLINDILDLSKIEAGKLELSKEIFSLTDMVTYLRRVFLPQSEKKQLEFTIEVAGDVPELIYTDRQRVTQILTNLLTNAIKFTDSGSVKITFAKLNDHLKITVIDTGIGIPDEKLEHIFGAFQQLDGSTSRKYGGSGLGLAISRNLAHLLDGEISVTSEIGVGSQFSVDFKHIFSGVARRESDSHAAVAEPVLISSKNEVSTSKNILLVEDDTRLLTILGRMITALGFNAIPVESAEKALIELGKVQITGVFLDLGLPKMSGMELLQYIKENPQLATTPVFIMSGSVDTGQAKTLGALGFLKKPVTRETIVESLKIMVQHEGEMSFPTTANRNTSDSIQILLIEDNAIDRKNVEKLLKDESIEITAVETGNEAFQLLQSQHIDMVILDLKLPDMSGFEWIEQAKQYLNPPPVIVYSARELTEREVFELKGVTESIVTKNALNSRLREEVLYLLNHLNSSVTPSSSELVTDKKILLVDDDARNLFALTKVLKAKGFRIEVAPDALKALELLAQESFDVLLTDIMMPDIDGYELIRRVRALGYNELPIIAITAKAMRGDDSLCLEAGANGYLSKPVDVCALIEMMNNITTK